MPDIAGKGRNQYYEGLFPGETPEDAEARRDLVRERDELIEDLKMCAQAHAVEERENERLREEVLELRTKLSQIRQAIDGA